MTHARPDRTSGRFGEVTPLGFLTLELKGTVVGLELTPETCDALINQLCDAANLLENRAEGKVA